MRPLVWGGVVLVLAVGLFHLTTLRDGHPWGGDFATYIRLARQLATRGDLMDTGYLYDPAEPTAPEVYPPVFPWLLVPVVAGPTPGAAADLPSSLSAGKGLVLAGFLGFLATFLVAFRGVLRPADRLAAAAILGFAPYFWDVKDQVLSDLPFLFFLYLTMGSLHRLGQARTPSPRLGLAVLAGVLMYVACGTRTAGLVLVPTLLARDGLRYRRIRRTSLVVLGVFASLYALQLAFWPGATRYLDQFVLSPQVIWNNLWLYAKAFSVLWDNGPSPWARGALYLVVLALAASGFLSRVKRGAGLWEIFPLLYAGLLIVWPSNQGPRFLIPLLPLFVVFAFVGLDVVGRRLARPTLRWLRAGLGAAILATYAVNYATTQQFGPLREGTAKPETRALFDFVQASTAQDDVFLFWNPRVLALFTDRDAAFLPGARDPATFWHRVDQISADFLVLGPNEDSGLRRLVDEQPGRFERVFHNRDFDVFHLIAPSPSRS